MQSQSVSSFESYFSSRFCFLSIIFIALLHISTWALLACLASFPRCSDFCFLIFLLSFSSLLPSTLASGESGFPTGSLTTSRPSSLESMESRFAAVQTCWSFVTRGGHTCVSNGFCFALWSPTFFASGLLMCFDDEDGEISGHSGWRSFVCA